MATPSTNAIFVGIKGTVLALDRATGTELWRAELKGTDFVNVVVDTDSLYATTKGEIFCLDPASGHIRWHNRLQGLGWGLVTIGTPYGWQMTAIEQKRRRDAQATAAAGAAGAAG